MTQSGKRIIWTKPTEFSLSPEPVQDLISHAGFGSRNWDLLSLGSINDSYSTVSKIVEKDSSQSGARSHLHLNTSEKSITRKKK